MEWNNEKYVKYGFQEKLDSKGKIRKEAFIHTHTHAKIGYTSGYRYFNMEVIHMYNKLHLHVLKHVIITNKTVGTNDNTSLFLFIFSKVGVPILIR